MNLLFTLCGRAGSKGVKSKNIRDFIGYPLAYYSLSVIDLYRRRHGERFGRLDIALSTDSRELREQLGRTAVPVLMAERPPALAGDTVRKIDVIRDCARQAEAANGCAYDFVVDLDLTAPIRTVADLEHVVDKRLAAPEDTDVIFTVTRSRRNPYFNMVTRKGPYYDRVLKSTFATRQEAPEIFDMNASLYAYTRGYLEGQNPFFDRADIVLMPDTGFLDIDSEEDYRMIQVVAEYLAAHEPAYAEVREHIPAMLTGESAER